MTLALVAPTLFGLLVLLGVPLFVSRKLRRIPDALRRFLESSGQTAVWGPERATYRGASAEFTRVTGLGIAALTATRLIFRPIFGRQLEVPLDQVTGLREDKWFLRSYSSGRMHLILQLRSGAEVGFAFDDHAAWMAAVKANTLARVAA